MRPAGVGINLLPHAVRELDALGLLDRLSAQAIAPATLGYFAKNGARDLERAARRSRPATRGRNSRSTVASSIASCSRRSAERLGADRITLGHRLVDVDAATTTRRPRRSPDHAESTVAGPSGAVVAADGIHSAARAQFYPDQGPPKWSGALLWRGVVEREPVLDGRTMIWIGHPAQKFVGYPIADLAATVAQAFNFIAELRVPTTPTLADARTGTAPATSPTSCPRSRTGASTGSTCRR